VVPLQIAAIAAQTNGHVEHANGHWDQANNSVDQANGHIDRDSIEAA
jgi:hypothetical protein